MATGVRSKAEDKNFEVRFETSYDLIKVISKKDSTVLFVTQTQDGLCVATQGGANLMVKGTISLVPARKKK